ncbi:lipid A deacylase LpxR family protein [Herbaspirillum sp. HC18]|nr:lipid A deacylase LpxR family protein [Herbaspirillum sp. HC18]
MHAPLLKPVTVCVLLLAAANAHANPFAGLAEDYESVRTSGSVWHIADIDNDSLLLNKNDGFYTSGLRYTQSYALKSSGRLTIYGWRIGQELYTASDINLPPERVQPPDHPYAGWLYGGFFKESWRADGTHSMFGIDIGCIGPCAGGEWTQTTLHKMINQPLPQGWSKQVRNEAGVVLRGEIAPVRWTPNPSIDITPVFNARFGNIFTDAGAGLTVRAGRLNVFPAEPALHAYARVEARAVGYNATLQGGYFSNDNPHTVDPKRFVGEAEAGIAWNQGAYGAKAAIIRRSNEIKDLPNSIGAQTYVHLQFSYTP